VFNSHDDITALLVKDNKKLEGWDNYKNHYRLVERNRLPLTLTSIKEKEKKPSGVEICQRKRGKSEIKKEGKREEGSGPGN